MLAPGIHSGHQSPYGSFWYPNQRGDKSLKKHPSWTAAVIDPLRNNWDEIVVGVVVGVATSIMLGIVLKIEG
jgi:hypothetical protein